MADNIHTCTKCYIPCSGSKTCSGCRNAVYCSEDCQKADWPLHRTLCRTFKAFGNRPDHNLFRAILFPVDESKPRFVWLKRNSSFRGLLETDTVFGEKSILALLVMQSNIFRDRKMHHELIFAFHDNFLNDNSLSINRSAHHFTKGMAPHPWAGPLLVYATSAETLDNLDTTDLRDIKDYLLSYGSCDREIDTLPGEIVEGVRINCMGERKRLSLPYFEPIEIYTSHPFFKQSKTSPIADHIDLSLLSFKIPTPDLEINYTYNRFATYLHMNCLIDTFGWAAPYWQSKVCNIVVVRKDFQPLSPKTLEILCVWCLEELQLYFEVVQEMPPGERQAGRKKMLDHYVTRENFDEFQIEYQQENRVPDSERSEDWTIQLEWAQVVSCFHSGEKLPHDRYNKFLGDD